MKILQLVLVLLFSIATFLVNGQTNKKVSELLQIESDCPVPPASKSSQPEERMYAEAMEDEVPYFESDSKKKTPPKPIVPPSTETWTNQLSSYLKDIKEETPTKQFGENQFKQDEDFIWKLYSSDGKVLLQSEFEYVTPSPTYPAFVAKLKGSKGYNIFDKNGKALLQKEYQYMYPPYHNQEHVLIGEAGLIGAASLDGKMVIEPQYDWMEKRHNAWIAKKGEYKCALDAKGKVLIPLTKKHKDIKVAYTNDNSDFFMAEATNKELIIYKKGKVANQFGIRFYEWAEPRIFDKRYLFYNNKLIDLKNKQYILCGDKVKIERSQVALNLFSIKKNRKHYAFNYKGELLVEMPVGNSMSGKQFNDGHAVLAVLTDRKNPLGYNIANYGVIDKESNWVMPATFPYLKMVRDTTLLFAVLDLKMGMIDLKGNPIIPFEYSRLELIGKRVAAYYERNSYEAQIFDLSGKKLFKATLEYKYLSKNSVGYEGQRLSDKKRVMLDDQFNEIYEKKFNNKGKLGDDAFWIERFATPKEYEILDMKGQLYPMMIDGQPRTDYKKVQRVWRTPFAFFELSDGEKYIYNFKTKKVYPINNELNYVSDGLYKSHGLLICSRQYRKEMGLIDGMGNEILPPAFNGIGRTGRFVQVSTKERTHIFSSNGKEMFPEYEQIRHLGNNAFLIKNDGKYGVINHKGKMIIPIEYKNINTQNPFYKVTTMSGEVLLFAYDGTMVKKNK